MRRPYFSLAVACLLAGTLWASDDPFCGKWKLSVEKSKFAGEQIKVQDLGDNKYKWTHGNVTSTITYDGTDQPVSFGRTMSMAPEGTNTWRMVIKKGGEVPMKGLGKFKVVKRKARMGRNPATGEAIKIPAKTVVRFTVAKALKDLIKKK